MENENRDKPIVPACRSRPVVSAKTIHIGFILIVCMKSMFLQAIVCENLEKNHRVFQLEMRTFLRDEKKSAQANSTTREIS